MITHHTKNLSASEWEDAVEADLRSLGYEVGRLGDSIPRSIRQVIMGTTARTVRYAADFIARRGEELVYVDAKQTGDIHYWEEKWSAHRHMVDVACHDHYLHVSRYEGIPFLYAFPCGRLCGYTGESTDRYPHPSYMHVETFSQAVTERSGGSLFILHGEHCQPTPADAIGMTGASSLLHLEAGH